MNKLRIVIADDERPARNFLKAILQNFDDVEIVGEAESGMEAVEIIKQAKPDLALLDLQMPDGTGLEAVKILKKTQMPLVAFVTAYDEYAVQAFEVNAIDYLLKPVEQARLRETINRAAGRLEQSDFQEKETVKLKAAVIDYEKNIEKENLERIPVRVNGEILLVPVSEIVSIVANGELMVISDIHNKKHTINYRLKDLEKRLDSNLFVRLSRGAMINLKMIERISPMPGGTYSITLKNGQEINSSRLQSKILRGKFLKL